MKFIVFEIMSVFSDHPVYSFHVLVGIIIILYPHDFFYFKRKPTVGHAVFSVATAPVQSVGFFLVHTIRLYILITYRRGTSAPPTGDFIYTFRPRISKKKKNEKNK